ncbi:MAG TPA: Hpt domain-containing protein, partial [Steroidobacteraceae bacterium]|nr:Hpt domain-containing protein [Steroidobacteraceae bacterium]
MAEVASQTLEFVGRELNVALGEARSALESYVEQPENLGLLERCTRELHQVQGVLRVLEIYGAALLAEEMEQVARYLISTASERKNPAESLDALMRAMVQLPSYLERVLAGGRDLALVLLPLLNDLRAVRGCSLLSEGTLLLLNLKSDREADPAAATPGEPALPIEHWARRLRARFQIGLVGWIRGERLDENLETLASVAEQLERVATEQPVFQLWWVVGAVLEALREGGLEGGVSVKRLLGLADREIKRLYEQGEARYAQNPPVELLNNLLYYVGRADCSGPRVTAVRTSFRLAELLPVDESIEQERESLSAPSVKLMQTVAAAIREDLAKVKDVLDIFVRRRAGPPEELAPQVQLLRKIGDTLGVLGLGELRAAVQAETERLEQIVAGRLQADESTLVEIAATLIGVEDRLDEGLVGMILPRAASGSTLQEADSEFLQVQAAVLRECILNLARLKEAVAQNVGGTLDASGLDAWHELMRGLKAGLLMLGKTRAVELVEAIYARLKPVMQPGGGTLVGIGLDRLADAIVSLEYYMETLQAGRSDPWYMLDNAQACLQALDAQPVPAVPTVAPIDASAFAQTIALEQPGQPAPAAAVQFAPPQPSVVPPTLAPRSPAAVLAEHADPELVNLFVEESHEELERIQRLYPIWDQNPLEQSALVTVRRCFHTLKGSGRMVGARDLSEFAWSIENLLNRLLDHTLERSPEIVTVLREAVAALPELIRQLESGAAPHSDIASLVRRAHSLAAGGAESRRGAAAEDGETAEGAPGARPLASRATKPVAARAQEATTLAASSRAPAAGAALAAAASAARPVQPGGEGGDDVLREIYTREANAHIGVVRAYIAREMGRPEPHELTEEVYRACHTLSGSSKMADVRHGIRLAQPLDHWLRRVFDSALGLTRTDLDLLMDSMSAMESVAAHLDESTGYFIMHGPLYGRIGDAERRLDGRLAAAAAAAERTGLHGSARKAPAGEEDFPPLVDTLPAVHTVMQPPAEEIVLTADDAPEHEIVLSEETPSEEIVLSDATGVVARLAQVEPAQHEPQQTEPQQTEPAQDDPAAVEVAEVDAPAAHTAATSSADDVAASTIPATPDFDPEVAAIFTDEATELIEICESALGGWRADP